MTLHNNIIPIRFDNIIMTLSEHEFIALYGYDLISYSNCRRDRPKYLMGTE